MQQKKSPRKRENKKVLQTDELDILYNQILGYLGKLPKDLLLYKEETNNLSNLFHMAEKLYLPLDTMKIHNATNQNQLQICTVKLEIALYITKYKKIIADTSDINVKFDGEYMEIKLPLKFGMNYMDVLEIKNLYS